MALRCEMTYFEFYEKVLKDDQTCVNYLTTGILQTLESSKCGKVLDGVECDGVLQKKEKFITKNDHYKYFYSTWRNLRDEDMRHKGRYQTVYIIFLW